ncbi:DUF6445 family protein [Asticcacaulis endophyticus]|uniref:Uncharacterized protein n=1 Tax=Asticcacaulis endophyticus TaxID=1395890 RepID=A0A918PYK3_9CAUL|nr:DUF6445 family protein [Asticcacaulis endophyticus]GGZ27462.1 hypothetical protein GCM10011273_11440 [Asticcacaulis endophyticus]
MTTPNFTPEFNPAARLEARHIGRERQPLLIIDNVLKNPQGVLALATQTPFIRPDNSAYPGLNAPMPVAYGQALAMALQPILHQGFGLPKSAPLQFHSFLALATLAASELKPYQRIPHFDSTDPFRLAVVHYFCDGPHGGTGFFRQRATGFETVSPSQMSQFDQHAADDLRRGLPDHYTSAQTPSYEMIAAVDAAFDRLIVYRNNCLHSALLGGSPLTDDPRTGRLTVNTFISPA